MVASWRREEGEERKEEWTKHRQEGRRVKDQNVGIAKRRSTVPEMSGGMGRWVEGSQRHSEMCQVDRINSGGFH